MRKGSDITAIRRVLGAKGEGIRIIAKIENQEGLVNFDDILELADGVMARRRARPAALLFPPRHAD